MKDMPTLMTVGTKISSWLPRGDHREVLINNQNKTIMELESNSVIGTSSIRRRSQILNLRRDLVIKLIRGNVDTRIDKLNLKEYDALILGHGGIKRLNFEHKVTQIFSINEILPPACQASIGIQTLEEDNELISLISNTNHQDSSIIGITERKVLEVLGANCNSPIGVYASIRDNEIHLKTEIFSHDGKEKFYAEDSSKVSDHVNLANKVGDMIIDQVGTNYIKELDNLKDDFNYTP
jgi:hydroxymethylbilane synthase